VETVERAGEARPGQAARARRLWIAAAVIGGALGFLVFQGLDNATVYFRTASEAVADRTELGTRRFRIEGVVVTDSVRQSGDNVRFAIAENGTTVEVRHVGDPPELFRPTIPVVLEGRWDGTVFASDRIMVKHTSEYKARNPERVKDYDTEAPSSDP
jgi:cytochrome c-type biogenesis protein CcmE